MWCGRHTGGDSVSQVWLEFPHLELPLRSPLFCHSWFISSHSLNKDGLSDFCGSGKVKVGNEQHINTTSGWSQHSKLSLLVCAHMLSFHWTGYIHFPSHQWLICSLVMSLTFHTYHLKCYLCLRTLFFQVDHKLLEDTGHLSRLSVSPTELSILPLEQ